MKRNKICFFGIILLFVVSVCFFLKWEIVSKAASNAFLTYTASWSGISNRKCTTITTSDTVGYANATVYEYNDVNTLVDFGYNYQNTQNQSATASASDKNVAKARVINYLTDGANGTGNSMGFEDHTINKGQPIS